ncbi:unnamed protein product, partial [Amoebophrya sp. A25]
LESKANEEWRRGRVAFAKSVCFPSEVFAPRRSSAERLSAALSDSNLLLPRVPGSSTAQQSAGLGYTVQRCCDPLASDAGKQLGDRACWDPSGAFRYETCCQPLREEQEPTSTACDFDLEYFFDAELYYELVSTSDALKIDAGSNPVRSEGSPSVHHVQTGAASATSFLLSGGVTNGFRVQ